MVDLFFFGNRSFGNLTRFFRWDGSTKLDTHRRKVVIETTERVFPICKKKAPEKVTAPEFMVDRKHQRWWWQRAVKRLHEKCDSNDTKFEFCVHLNLFKLKHLK